MIIHKLSVKRFFGFDTLDLALPERGLVVVQGNNGRGKTARTITAPSWICWGLTERGTPPHPAEGKPNVTGTIDVTTNKGQRLSIARTWKASKKDVQWGVDGAPPVEYATTSKAQEALEALLGDYMLWRRTHVFSAADAAMFSHADDSTRKRLLETMLSLDIFDAPLAQARTESKRLGDLMGKLEMEHATLTAKYKQLVEHGKQMRELLMTDGDVPDMDELTRRTDELMEKKRTAATKERELAQEVGAVEAKAQRAAADLHKLGDGKCRTCGQPLPHADLDRHRHEVEEAQREAAETRARVAEMQAKVRAFLAKVDTAIQNAIVTKRNAKQAEQAAQVIAQTKAQLTEMKQRAEAITQEVNRLDRQAKVADHAARLLSTKGIRSMMLGKALSSLTDLTNAYLERLRPGTSIELSPTSETKGGKVVDAISLNITGMGGGWGYKATSGGERKRVDIALLLALSSLAGSKGTLIFDEAMDAVDADGVENVSALLMDVAQTRPVVIITHNAALADSLAGATRVAVK